MAKTDSVLRQAENALRSSRIEVRDEGVRQLHIRITDDAGIRRAALPILLAATDIDLSPYTANLAVDGIELLGGFDAAKDHRLRLLSDSRPPMVRAILLSMREPRYVPALIDTLSNRSEEIVRVAALRQLGRLGTEAALPALLNYLDDSALRPHVVEALAELGDPAAIASLETLLVDTTEAWPEDNHGPMLRVCDLAEAALARLRESS